MKKESVTRTITMTKENLEHCKNIAEELYKISVGEMVNIDGEAVEVQTDEEGYTFADHNGVIYSDNPDKVSEGEDISDLEPYTMYDYFVDVFDIAYTVGDDMDYRGVRLMVACGGPNIYINTNTGKVELYWWTDYAEAWLEREVVEEIDRTFEDIYTCR